VTDTPPLILTLAMDERSFALFDEQRRRYFPPARNHIPAHLTLFHKLPAEQHHTIADDVLAATAAQPAFAVNVTGLRSLGRGVAYTLESPTLSQFRRGLAMKWALWLTLQDRQKHQPHVTIQNKVEPEVARSLLANLTDNFVPFSITAEGVGLWRYKGGPWEHVETFPFGPNS
jgi:2'-5' RNA ligase superfamily